MDGDDKVVYLLDESFDAPAMQESSTFVNNNAAVNQSQNKYLNVTYNTNLNVSTARSMQSSVRMCRKEQTDDYDWDEDKDKLATQQLQRYKQPV